jgi:hypothetical protein
VSMSLCVIVVCVTVAMTIGVAMAVAMGSGPVRMVVLISVCPVCVLVRVAVMMMMLMIPMVMFVGMVVPVSMVMPVSVVVPVAMLTMVVASMMMVLQTVACRHSSAGAVPMATAELRAGNASLGDAANLGKNWLALLLALWGRERHEGVQHACRELRFILWPNECKAEGELSYLWQQTLALQQHRISRPQLLLYSILQLLRPQPITAGHRHHQRNVRGNQVRHKCIVQTTEGAAGKLAHQLQMRDRVRVAQRVGIVVAEQEPGSQARQRVT